MPHLLGSAYLLGASPDQLQDIYDDESKQLEPWPASPAEITDSDWREYLGDKKYQRAYVDFFEDELALKFGYDWSKVVEEYLFSGDKPPRQWTDCRTYVCRRFLRSVNADAAI